MSSSPSTIFRFASVVNAKLSSFFSPTPVPPGACRSARTTASRDPRRPFELSREPPSFSYHAIVSFQGHRAPSYPETIPPYTRAQFLGTRSVLRDAYRAGHCFRVSLGRPVERRRTCLERAWNVLGMALPHLAPGVIGRAADGQTLVKRAVPAGCTDVGLQARPGTSSHRR